MVHSGVHAPDARAAAVRLVRRLRDAGFVAYFAGGCVRDELLGIVPKDFDIATDARPADVCRIFRGSREVGQAFGVVLVRREGTETQVATFRTDGPYTDRRRPDHVTFAGAQEDAHRRDFTINGLFLDPESGEVLDFVGGRRDLQEGVIRAIGDADRRLDEDHLRMLRAVRFAARYRFRIESSTAAAIERHVPRLAGVSRERIGQELRLMLEHPSRGDAVALLTALGLDRAILMEAPVGRGRSPRVDGIEGPADWTLPLAAWMLDRWGGTPPREAPAAWSRALVLSGAEQKQLRDLIAVRARILGSDATGSGPGADRDVAAAPHAGDEACAARGWRGMRVAARRRLAGGAVFPEAMRLLETGPEAERQAAAEIRAALAAFREVGVVPPPFVRGDDLVALGAKPGPSLGRLLRTLYDEQLEGAVRTRAEALGRAAALISTRR